jgi:mono/diheme cytochrome c family protein
MTRTCAPAGIRRSRRLWPLLLGACALALPQVGLAERKTNRVLYTETEGKQIYLDRCALCHMADGRGRSDGVNGFPPLTGMSEWMATREGQLYVAHAIIFGPYGDVLVGDQFYFGMMPRFGPRFDNGQIVAVIRYMAEELNDPLAGYVPIDESLVEEARRLPDNMEALVEERMMLTPR